MVEIWKQIGGFEGLYMVSNMGNIKSLQREHSQIYSTGKVGVHKVKEKILRKRHDTKGYSTCILYRKGRAIPKKVHRIVAYAFLDNPKKYPQVNHKNGIKDDNRVENLEWCDNSYNQKHAFKTGLRENIYQGENNNLSKLNNNDVLKIRMAKYCGIKTKELVSMFCVDRHTISNIVSGRSWKHLSFKVL